MPQNTIFKGGPTIMALNPINDQIYATNEYFNTLSVTSEAYFPSLIAIACNKRSFESNTYWQRSILLFLEWALEYITQKKDIIILRHLDIEQ